MEYRSFTDRHTIETFVNWEMRSETNNAVRSRLTRLFFLYCLYTLHNLSRSTAYAIVFAFTLQNYIEWNGYAMVLRGVVDVSGTFFLKCFFVVVVSLSVFFGRYHGFNIWRSHSMLSKNRNGSTRAQCFFSIVLFYMNTHLFLAVRRRFTSNIYLCCCNIQSNWYFRWFLLPFSKFCLDFLDRVINSPKKRVNISKNEIHLYFHQTYTTGRKY